MVRIDFFSFRGPNSARVFSRGSYPDPFFSSQGSNPVPSRSATLQETLDQNPEGKTTRDPKHYFIIHKDFITVHIFSVLYLLEDCGYIVRLNFLKKYLKI
mgnify:CR=1 FL=1